MSVLALPIIAGSDDPPFDFFIGDTIECPDGEMLRCFAIAHADIEEFAVFLSRDGKIEVVTSMAQPAVDDDFERVLDDLFKARSEYRWAFETIDFKNVWGEINTRAILEQLVNEGKIEKFLVDARPKFRASAGLLAQKHPKAHPQMARRPNTWEPLTDEDLDQITQLRKNGWGWDRIRKELPERKRRAHAQSLCTTYNTIMRARAYAQIRNKETR